MLDWLGPLCCKCSHYSLGTIPVSDVWPSLQVCNHKSECHCHAGWAPPYCTELLTDVYKGKQRLISWIF